nr:hypothetical protein [Methylomonas fluvii]
MERRLSIDCPDMAAQFGVTSSRSTGDTPHHLNTNSIESVNISQRKVTVDAG